MDLNMKVLVVDDMASMRRILKNVLKKMGFKNIFEADDGMAAMEELEKNEIDFIISDWNMPEKTGIELLKDIRASEKYKTTPFLMVTAEGQKQNVVDAVQAGVSQYVIKPFTPEQIKEKLDAMFKA